MAYKHREIKLVALDMDGTLLNHNHEISRANREAIKTAQDKGVHVILSTGRSILTCGKYAKSLNLTSYLITVNGSEIWKDTGKLLERNPLQPELVQWMWELSQSHQTEYWATSIDDVWRNQMPEDILHRQWLKFGFDIKENSVRKIILNELSGHPLLEISNSSPCNIEVNAAGINKARAIAKVCSHLDLSMENVMAVGDSLNDMEMIKRAGLGVAMENAQESVKHSADWVTAANHEDGVAEAIKRWVL